MNLIDVSYNNFAMGPLKTVVLTEESVICDDYRYDNYTLHWTMINNQYVAKSLRC